MIAARATGPLLLLTTSRVGRRGPTITLRPLSAEASAALVATSMPPWLHRPARGSWPEAKATRLLEELVLHAGAMATALPDTVQAVLAARMDALPAVQKRILQKAAVLGRAFWVEPVEQALGCRIDAHLPRLERAGFISRRRVSSLPGHAEYRFRHALTQEVAYASIPRRRRAREHAAVGDWLERASHPDAVMIADHFAAATGDEAVWPDPTEREWVRARVSRPDTGRRRDPARARAEPRRRPARARAGAGLLRRGTPTGVRGPRRGPRGRGFPGRAGRALLLGGVGAGCRNRPIPAVPQAGVADGEHTRRVPTSRTRPPSMR